MRRCSLLAALAVTVSGCKAAPPAALPAPAPAHLADARSKTGALDEIRESFCTTRRAPATCSATARDETAYQNTDLLPTTHLRADGKCCYRVAFVSQW